MATGIFNAWVYGFTLMSKQLTKIGFSTEQDDKIEDNKRLFKLPKVFSIAPSGEKLFYNSTRNGKAFIEGTISA